MMGAYHFPVLGVEIMRPFPVLGVEMTVLPFCSQCPSPLLGEKIVEVCASPLFDAVMMIGAYSFPVLAQAQLPTPVESHHPAPPWGESTIAGAPSLDLLVDVGEDKTGVYKCPLSEEEKRGLHPRLVGEERAGFHSAASLGMETPGDLLSPLWQEMAGAHPPPRLEGGGGVGSCCTHAVSNLSFVSLSSISLSPSLPVLSESMLIYKQTL